MQNSDQLLLAIWTFISCEYLEKMFSKAVGVIFDEWESEEPHEIITVLIGQVEDCETYLQNINISTDSMFLKGIFRMLKYKTRHIDFENEDLIWEAFEGFWDLFLSSVPIGCEGLNILTDIQKNLIVFNFYRGSVLRGGHQSFVHLYMDSIGIKAVKDSLLTLGIDNELILALERIPETFSFLDALDDDEEKSKLAWEQLENFFEPINATFYKYSEEGYIEDKMIQYLRENATEFFEVIV